jgi:geranylgeranylglycerol-phosphate geranylgeranyltransferase
MASRFLVSIEIMRPHNMLAAGLCVAAGYHVAGGADASLAWGGAVAAALATGAGNVINDYFDLEIDRVNKPRRPLPSGRLSPRVVLGVYAVLALSLLGFAFVALPLRVAILVAGWLVALLTYAAALKRVVLVGNLLVAAIASSAFIAGGMLAGDVLASVLPFAIAFFFVLSRELVKGAEDVAGDRAAGVQTVAVALGVDRAAFAAAVLMLGLATLVPVPALAGHYGPKYFWTMTLLVVPGLIGGSYLVLERRDRRTFSRVSWILKVGMFFGILAIALARS